MVEQPERFTISEGLRIAGECFEEGKYNRSFQIYSEIIKVKPDNLIACKRLALINESYGRHEEALSFYKRIISLFPVDVEFIASYIRLLIKTGNISEARQMLEKSQVLFEKSNADDQLLTLVKQLQPENKLEFFYKYLSSLGIFEYQPGQLMVSDSKAIPLLTNSFLSWFETQHWGDKTLLELGSGSSTLYFAKHFSKVISLETNQEWYSKLSNVLPSNVEYIKTKNIIKSIDSIDLHSCNALLLDCAENRAVIAKYLCQKQFRGVVFFDNSEWYRNGIKLFITSGYREIPFFGIKPVEDWVSCTSVLFNDQNLDSITASHWKKIPSFSNYRPYNSWDMVED